MKTLIKNGRIVTAVDDYLQRLDMDADVVLDTSGKLVKRIKGGL